MDPFTIAIGTTIANIGYSEIKDRQLRKQNRELSNTYDDQISKLSDSVSGIEKFSEGLIELETDTSNIRRGDMFSDFLSKSEDINTTYQANLGKTDLVSSGSIEESSRRERERLNRKIKLGEADESLRTEKNLLNILTSKEDSLASVRNEIFNLESAKAGLRT
jgi:hypothetical protein|tara:strand:- start:138 stop:626 length:489 start_codon:yes stop_codon:yes gene_type:complete